MSKTKRLLAMTLAVLMMMSLFTVITFAATPVFAEDYVDPTGTIRNTALYVSTSLRGRTGDVTAKWDGKDYTFTMGKNAFGTIAAAMEAADLNMSNDRSQILLGAGTYGDITINMPLEIYGEQWNVNPNVKDASDPTKAWTLNSAWGSNTSNVNAVIISAGAYDAVTVQGVKIQGHIYDIQRAVSSAEFTLTFKNILYSQTSGGIATTQTNSSTRSTNTNYAMSFRNFNANNANENGKLNKDKTYFTNFRVDKLVNTRFIDEQVSPVFVFDGLYMDLSHFTDQAFWMKWMGYFTDCEFAIKNSYLFNAGTKATALHFEGYSNGVVGDGAAKLPVGTFEGQTAALNFTNNVFKNIVGVTTATDETTGVVTNKYTYMLAANIHSYSSINISDNIVINDKPIDAWFFSMGYTSNATDYTDIVKVNNNVFLGQTALAYNYGTDNSKADFTGNYIAPAYSADWQTKAEGILPTGKIAFEYCYLDGALTQKTNEVPDFTITGADINKTAKTVTATAAAGAENISFDVNGLSGYAIYESDANFSNASDFAELTPVDGALTLKNLNNYFLFVALSYDANTKVPYKMTVTKPENSGVKVNDLNNLSSGASVDKDGLEFNVLVERNTSSFSFGLDTDASSVRVTKPDGSILAADNGIYSLSDLVMGELVVLKVRVSKDGVVEYYYINVTRNLSNKTSIVSVSNNVVLTGTKITANAGEDVTEFTFDIAVSEGATVAAWQGTAVYPMIDGKITVKDLKSGDNKFTVGVTAENGVDFTNYELIISKPKSTEAELVSIKNADEDEGVYYATATDAFTVEPKLSYGATFKVYADEACTEEIDARVEVTSDTTVYIVVIAEDGVTKSEPVELVIYKEYINTATGSFTVEGATANELSPYILDVVLADNLTETTLKIKAENATYKLYADTLLSVPATEKLTLDSGITAVYAYVTYDDGTEEVYSIMVYSARTGVKYKDASSIPGWAQTYVNALNDAGLGIMKGDEKGNFNASNNMTRYEIAAIAIRLLGFDATQFAGVELEYTDKIASWAEKYVKAVTALGIMGGSNDKNGKLVFNGQGNTTRAQLAKIIVEVAILTLGSDATAEEFYVLLQEFVDEIYNSYSFADEASVQTWAKTYVKLAVGLGFFNGKTEGGKNIIDPNSNIKRSEIAAVCARFLGIAE